MSRRVQPAASSGLLRAWNVAPENRYAFGFFGQFVRQSPSNSGVLTCAMGSVAFAAGGALAVLACRSWTAGVVSPLLPPPPPCLADATAPPIEHASPFHVKPGSHIGVPCARTQTSPWSSVSAGHVMGVLERAQRIPSEALCSSGR